MRKTESSNGVDCGGKGNEAVVRSGGWWESGVRRSVCCWWALKESTVAVKKF
jgi:hypothetical protein